MIVAGVVFVLAAFLAVGEMRKRTCIEEAAAKYPAVAVSAFSGRATGSLKVSFGKQPARSRWPSLRAGASFPTRSVRTCPAIPWWRSGAATSAASGTCISASPERVLDALNGEALRQPA
jgi:hypothetical protein